jgi:hypothetical protein
MTLLAAGFVVLAAGGALFFVVNLATRPRLAADPTPAASAPPPPPVATPFTQTPPPPLSFVEKENEKRLEPVEKALGGIKTALGKADFSAAKALCKAIARDVTLLASEPHPRPRAAVDGTRRACECDLPVAALGAALDGIAKAPGTKKTACKDAVRYVDELKANKYGDDPAVQSVLARFGATCAT